MMYKVNDRVSRQINIGESERRIGTIVKITKSRQGISSCSFNLYDIKWDDLEEISVGHMEAYLQIER